MPEITTSDLTCPFCGETDFDGQGLAYHIKMRCDKCDELFNAFIEAETRYINAHIERSNKRKEASDGR